MPFPMKMKPKSFRYSAATSLPLLAMLSIHAQPAFAGEPALPIAPPEIAGNPSCSATYVEHIRETGKSTGLGTDGNLVALGSILAEYGIRSAGTPALGIGGAYGVLLALTWIAASEGVDAAVDAPYLRMLRAVTAARWATGLEARPTFEGLLAFADQEIPQEADGSPDYREARRELRDRNREIVKNHRRFEKALRDAESGFMNLFIQQFKAGVQELELRDGGRVDMTPANFARKLSELDRTQLLCSGEVGNDGLSEPTDLEIPRNTEGLTGRELKQAERENRRIENRNDKRWKRYDRNSLATPSSLRDYLLAEQANRGDMNSSP